MLEAALKPVPPFFVYFTFESWMLSSLTSGMSPVHGIFDALSQVLLMGLFRFISLVYLWDFDRIIFKCGKEKMQ
jgi:3-dehydrosphinganine reductase